jgi:glycosyltransferase involved in cell wall biosynthesis
MTKFIFLAGMAGNNDKPWGDHSLADGLGGSESSLIHLARELAKTCNVKVFNNCERSGELAYGVTWMDYSKFALNQSYYTEGAIVVSWRQPHLLVGIKGKQNWNWDHNGVGHPDPTPEQWQWIDKFVCLNQWHADQYIARGAQREKVVIGGAAIDYTPFDEVAKENLPRIPYRAVCHAHPLRGWDKLIEYWIDVRRALPQATLQMMWWDDELTKRFKPIPELGILPVIKAGPMQVARQLSLAQVFAYPAVGTETAPLTVLEAQAAGAFPCVIPVGGMTEVMVDALQCNHENFANNLIWLLRECNNGTEEKARARMMSKIRKEFNWASVAQKWLDDFSTI